MLKFTFKRPENMIYSVDDYFNSWYKDEWFNDDLVKEMVKDIDKTEIIGPNLAISPVFGAMPPTKISGGVKTLILALKTDIIIYGAACCDNCAKWFIEIGKLKDVVIFLSYPMQFPHDFEAICIDDNSEIHTPMDLLDVYYDNTDAYE